MPHPRLDVQGTTGAEFYGTDQLVAGIAESASILTLQEADVSSSEELLPSSEEPISARPGTVPRSSVDGSSSSFLFSEEEFVAGPAESASARTLQEPDASTLEKLDTASLEGLITACPRTALHNTIDGSVSALPFGRDKIGAVTTEYASALSLQNSDISSSEELLDSTSSEEASSPRTVPHCTTDGYLSYNPFGMEKIAESDVLHDTADGSPPSVSSVGPPILFRYPPNWYQTFYMRVDCEGNFHMYPDLGGPFHSLQEAEAAISLYLNKLRRPDICEKPSNGPLVEWRINQCLYYPDGTRKRGPESPACKNPFERQRQLVKALLDQYNEYHNLCKDLARELKDFVHFQYIYEDHKTYYHFNFTTRTKADDDNLFFAEVSRQGTEDAFVVSCCCMIEPNDNGHCYGCCNNGNREMMHPSNTRAYIAGHVNGYLPFGGDDFSDEEEDEEAYEARLRVIFRER